MSKRKLGDSTSSTGSSSLSTTTKSKLSGITTPGYAPEHQSFWPNMLAQAENLERKDFKHHELPLARIKKIMKADEDVRMISAEAPVLFAKACELFVIDITLRSWATTLTHKRRTLQRSDVVETVDKTDIYDFLVDLVPRQAVEGEETDPTTDTLVGKVASSLEDNRNKMENEKKKKKNKNKNKKEEKQDEGVEDKQEEPQMQDPLGVYNQTPSVPKRLQEQAQKEKDKVKRAVEAQEKMALEAEITLRQALPQSVVPDVMPHQKIIQAQEAMGDWEEIGKK